MDKLQHQTIAAVFSFGAVDIIVWFPTVFQSGRHENVPTAYRQKLAVLSTVGGHRLSQWHHSNL